MILPPTEYKIMQKRLIKTNIHKIGLYDKKKIQANVVGAYTHTTAKYVSLVAIMLSNFHRMFNNKY